MCRLQAPCVVENVGVRGKATVRVIDKDFSFIKKQVPGLLALLLAPAEQRARQVVVAAPSVRGLIGDQAGQLAIEVQHVQRQREEEVACDLPPLPRAAVGVLHVLPHALDLLLVLLRLPATSRDTPERQPGLYRGLGLLGADGVAGVAVLVALAARRALRAVVVRRGAGVPLPPLLGGRRCCRLRDLWRALALLGGGQRSEESGPVEVASGQQVRVLRPEERPRLHPVHVWVLEPELLGGVDVLRVQPHSRSGGSSARPAQNGLVSWRRRVFGYRGVLAGSARRRGPASGHGCSSIARAA